MIKCLFFSHYTVQLDKVVDKYKVGRQLFADGSEPYDSFQPNQAAADVAVQNLDSCCRELKAWVSATCSN